MVMARILVTGANRGIGLEFVRQYAAEGAEVLACARDPDGAAELAGLVGAGAGRIQLERLDVADPAAIRGLGERLAGQALDIVINNAGIGGPRPQSAEAIDPEGWLTTFRVNAMAPLLLAQALHDNLRRGKARKLVAITSQLGSIANNSGGQYAYRSSKAALNDVMRGLSRDWAGEGIVVGIFHPGWVQTDMGGRGAPVTVEASVRGLRQRIAELTPETSGSFRDYSGATLPW
jgi:NAD(P)-dependent dehydrogenase (short-subunit alcohol dehydrogenase family)